MMPMVAAELVRSCTTADFTADPTKWPDYLVSSVSVGGEGLNVRWRAWNVVRVLEQHHVAVANVSDRQALSLAAPVPDTWLGLAHAVFPHSHALTRDERRSIDETLWGNVEPIRFSDE